MQFEALTELATVMLPYTLAVVLGLLITIGTGVLLVVKRRVPVVIGAGGAGMVALGGAAFAGWLLSAAAGGTAEGAYDAIRMASVTRFSGWFGMSAVALIGLPLLALAGARYGPRNKTWAGITAAGVAATVVLTVVAGAVNGEYGAGVFYYLRGAEYALFGVLVCVAMLSGGDDESTGPEAGASAAVIFALLVGVSEAAHQGMTKFYLISPLMDQPESNREAIVDGMLTLLGGEVYWGSAIVVLGAIVGMIGIASVSRKRPTPGNLAGVIWILVLLVVWFVGDPSRDAIVAAVTGGS